MSRYTRVEGGLQASVWTDLSAYAVADGATEMLLWVIEQTGLEGHEGEGEPPAAYVRAKALLYLGTIAVRVTRAAMAVLSVGYQAEVMTYKRTLMEAHSRVRHVMADESGEYARQWLKGRAGKPAKAVSEFSPDDHWDNLSHSSHADYRAVENLLAESQPDGHTFVNVGPERNEPLANATLAVFAGEVRDIANVIAHERRMAIPGLKMLDEAITEHFPWREPG